MELVPTTPRNFKPSRRNKSAVSFSSEMGLLDDAQCDDLPVSCTTEATFEDKVLLDWVFNAGWPSNVSVSRVSIKHLNLCAFLQAFRLTTVGMSFTQCKTPRPYYILVGPALYSTLLDVPFPIFQAALWGRKLFLTPAVNLSCLSTVRG